MLLAVTPLQADDASRERRIIEPRLLHLRSGIEREWSEFPETSQDQQLNVSFASTDNVAEQTLVVRQQDVKQVWIVSINGKKLGELVRDENDMVVTFTIPAGSLVDGDNLLKIESPSPNKWGAIEFGR